MPTARTAFNRDTQDMQDESCSSCPSLLKVVAVAVLSGGAGYLVKGAV
jgi:hypothetical protein